MISAPRVARVLGVALRDTARSSVMGSDTELGEWGDSQ